MPEGDQPYTGEAAKPYMQREPHIMAETAEQFAAKVAKNTADGRAKLASGEWKPFAGHSFENFKTLEVAQVVFDEASRQAVQERVVDPLRDLAEKHGVKAIFAGYGDQALHVTVDVAKFKDLSPEEEEKVNEWLDSDTDPDAAAKGHPYVPHLTRLGEIMVGKQFKFDQLVIGAPNSYVCASEVDESQVSPRRFREAVEKVWSRADKVLGGSSEGKFSKLYASYFDIFHSSIMRFTEHMTPEQATAFLEEAYATVGKDLKEHPVIVTVEKARFGNSAELLQDELPELMNGTPEDWKADHARKQEQRNADPVRAKLRDEKHVEI